VWTVDQQAYWQKQGLWPTAGNVDPSAFIENLFSTYLYTGNGSTQTITNGINLSGLGGLTWIKYRDGAFGNGHYLYDTVRGAGKVLLSNTTDAESAADSRFTSFDSNGFSLSTAGGSAINANTYPYVSWTFREQPKFFDVVTYTGTGSNTTIAHNLGAVPGCIIVKRTDTTAAWAVYHRSLANTQYLVLNTTAAAATGATWWNSTTPTSSVFSLGTDATVNASGGTYVAYLFAHDAGGFGLTGTDNVISCGSFTGGSPATVNLGYEPQWLLIKSTTNVDNWYMFDTMRGWTANFSGLYYLIANTSGSETAGSTTGLTSTGFQFNYGSGQTFIYIAIRRGPMAVPTLGTSVFSPQIATGNNVSNTFTTNFPVDLSIDKTTGVTGSPWWIDRLRGGTQYITSATTAAEATYPTTLIEFTSNTGIVNKNYGGTSSSYVEYMFRRAPGFFDEVCYTGTGVAGLTVAHNLTVVPELMIVKNRVNARNWRVYVAPLGASSSLNLNSDAADGGLGAALWNSTAPTSSVFSLGTDSSVNASADTYVAYLFATCAGVSKVGSYTGTGALQTIACGFTSGARFVLIKRTDATGDWYYWDSARGITSGNDPYLLLNSTAAEVTGTNYVDTDTTGFKVTAAAPAGINASGGTYIFLAIA
jgi:hypothetical protein